MSNKLLLDVVIKQPDVYHTKGANLSFVAWFTNTLLTANLRRKFKSNTGESSPFRLQAPFYVGFPKTSAQINFRVELERSRETFGEMLQNLQILLE